MKNEDPFFLHLTLNNDEIQKLNYQTEKHEHEKIVEESQTTWNKNLKPAVFVALPFFGMAIAAKIKNPQVGQATRNNSISINNGNILSITDTLGDGFCLKALQLYLE